MISRHLQPRTYNDELLEPATWQAVIGQLPPHVREWDPHDTSLLTLVGQRSINGRPCCHMPSYMASHVAEEEIAKNP
ncbi:hypothetical protein Tco_1010822 [Tanacetum coccineum]